MAGPLIWSSESLEDIDAIAQFIARDSRHHAQRVVEALLALGDAIEAQPLAGRAVPELGQSAVREGFLYSYRVIYEVSSARVTVLAVLHGRRLLDSVEDRLT
ncbi:type II toxin-antitoxin system mRNA interferase toxin, RelE/StbE family [Stenotrophomonas sp. ESTM1D_MKCIP4_1]|uniref:type II toxin-antitoxin system RelE/ParE family toxin n=1 Tax=Stenotrophomonas sp. ESTM1D_MKCIP4_1 TaxID=2072414 RepID=UPI000D53E92A|nr:type II toxin-antitoxin system RelE/ParE family toxin [Stenotrophomonas sp. ESTM1D_MKCIP4_1]AWH55191.1 type II toxin-antitoxin system mRNA interferase toxin, RelE/StbE family [Stenotrophomonas sp. ESTM1D_MKCIP4_1]